jgi:hypothetical protein
MTNCLIGGVDRVECLSRHTVDELVVDEQLGDVTDGHFLCEESVMIQGLRQQETEEESDWHGKDINMDSENKLTQQSEERAPRRSSEEPRATNPIRGVIKHSLVSRSRVGRRD